MSDESATPSPARPRVTLPDEAIQNDITQVENDGGSSEPVVFRPLVSALWAFGLALVGAAIWAGISYATDYQLGIVAIVIGVLAGVGAARGGRCRRAQYIGAGAAAFGFFSGQIILIFAMLLGGAFDAQLEAAAAIDAPAAETAAATDGSTGSPDVELTTAAGADDQEPGLFLAFLSLFWIIVVETFTSFSVVFLGIAVWEGYRLAGPSQ